MIIMCAICRTEDATGMMRTVTGGQFSVCGNCAGVLVPVFIDGEPRPARGGALIRRRPSSPNDFCDMCGLRPPEAGPLTGFESFAACRRDISIIAATFLRPGEPHSTGEEEESPPIPDTPLPAGVIRCRRCHDPVDTGGGNVEEGDQSLEIDTANGPDLVTFYVITAEGAVLHKCFGGRTTRHRRRHWERSRDETGSSPKHRRVFVP